ncbi:MAG: NUDIX domain-containing protein [candidate division WOR-3 bacterium]
MDFKKFQVYNFLREKISKEEIAQKFNVPIWFIENVEKYGYIDKLDEDFEKFYNFIDNTLNFNPKEISTRTGISENKVRRFLNMIKNMSFYTREEIEIINQLSNENRIDELTQIFNNYIKDSSIENLKPFTKIPLENVKNWVLPSKLIIDFYFNPSYETFKNFELYGKERKEEGKFLTYYFILLYKTIAINNFSSKVEDFQEVKDIYYEIYEKIKPICPKIILFELNRQAYISSLRIADKKLLNKTLSEMRKLLKLVNEEFKPYLKISLFYLYAQYGNFKKAGQFLENLDENLEFVKEAKIILKFNNCEYKEIIKTDLKFSSKLSNLNYQFLKAFSYLMLGNFNQAIEIIVNMERVENVKEIPIFFAKLYAFLSIYYKMLNEEEKSKEALSFVMNYQSLNDLAITKAIYYKDSSYLNGLTIQQLILKYYLEGRINKAIELSKNNNNKHFLKVCAILLPKSIKKIKKYPELSDILDYAKKPIIKLFILREEPILVIENKTYYLNPNEVFASIVKIIRKKHAPTYLFNKNTLKYLRKLFKGLLTIRKNEIIINAKIYFDFLLLKHKTYWGFAKGKIEENEDELNSAIRELYEETSIKDIEIYKDFRKEIYYNYYLENRLIRKKLILFLARAKSKKFCISDEHSAGGWFEFKDALNLVRYENNKRVLIEANEYIINVILNLKSQ